MATLTGLEPATSAVTGRRANQLRYRALLVVLDGAVVRAPNGVRTRATALKGRRPGPLDDEGSSCAGGRENCTWPRTGVCTGSPTTAWRPGGSPLSCQHPRVRSRDLLLVNRSVVLAAAVLLTAGCADRSGTDAAASTGKPTTISAAAPDATAAASTATEEAAAEGADATALPFPADTSADVADPVQPDGLTVTAVRAARHEGYDRVVFEFAGSGTPGWSVEYVDAPSSQGSGAAVDVPGRTALQVTVQGTSYPYEAGAAEIPAGPVAVSGTDVVQGVVYDATFEGTSVAWIGPGGGAPFRVYALTAPSRLVIEVAGAG